MDWKSSCLQFKSGSWHFFSLLNRANLIIQNTSLHILPISVETKDSKQRRRKDLHLFSKNFKYYYLKNLSYQLLYFKVDLFFNQGVKLRQYANFRTWFARRRFMDFTIIWDSFIFIKNIYSFTNSWILGSSYQTFIIFSSVIKVGLVFDVRLKE